MTDRVFELSNTLFVWFWLFLARWLSICLAVLQGEKKKKPQQKTQHM